METRGPLKLDSAAPSGWRLVERLPEPRWRGKHLEAHLWRPARLWAWRAL